MWIYLKNNKLSALPDSFGKLSCLQWLDLNNNHLTSLPEGIGELTGLQRLSLHGNKLISIPESIGKLKSLRELFLSNNQLVSLPKSLKKLAKLENLNLINNPKLESVNIDSLPPNLRLLFIEREKLIGNSGEIFTSVEQCFEAPHEKISYKKFVLKISKIYENNSTIKILVTPQDLIAYVKHEDLVKHRILLK